MTAKRVLVIANKSWEVDPLIAALLHDKVRPSSATDFDFIHHPFLIDTRDPDNSDPEPLPRIQFSCTGVNVEVWCLQDLMNPKASGSSSKEKARVFPRIFEHAEPPPSAVIAVGSGFPRGSSANGNVVVGTRVFVHDPYAAEPPADHWPVPAPDTVVDSKVPVDFFRKVQEVTRLAAENRFVVPPIRAASPPRSSPVTGWLR